MNTASPVKTIEEQFQEFLSHYYPQGVPAQQLEVLRDLYFAGFTSALSTITEEIAFLPQGQDITAICSIRHQAHAYAAQRAADGQASAGN